MELWVSEYQTANTAFSTRVKETIFNGNSQIQQIAIVETEDFGRMLVLDNVIQTTEFDEAAYHEMIVHVPMFTHPEPKRILIIGGGDGGSVREAVKHSSIDKIDMVDIDAMVVGLCKKYLPNNSSEMENAKLNLKIGDGIQHLRESANTYDVIIVDCSDPIGPGEALFMKPFYQDILAALKEDGLFVQQTESPYYHKDLIRRIFKDIGDIFPIARLYLTNVPTYPSGMHCFTIGSKKYDPLEFNKKRYEDLGFKYYTKDLHTASFVLPAFVKKLIF